MSDISIPGVPGSSRLNTEQIIEDLMRVERVPLDRMESERSGFETRRGAWQEINRDLVRLRDTSQSLYSFENPFNERIANSSDETVLTASAERTAVEETSSIEVIEIAGRDRFGSNSIESDYEVSSGSYRFAVGEDEVGITFRGGSLESFARAINERAGDMLRARVIKNTSDTQVFVIESLTPGSSNMLRFLEDSAAFGIETGIVRPTDDTFRSITADRQSVRSLTNPISDDYVTFGEDGAIVAPQSAMSIPITPSLQTKENLVMEISYSVTRIPYEYTPPVPPPGPSSPSPDSVVFDGITIRNAASRVISPEWNPPEPPQQIDDLEVFALNTGSRSISLPSIEESDGSYTMQIALEEYADFVSRLDVDNKNTHSIVTISGLKIYDPTSRGEYLPLNPIETASNAVVLIDGIEVVRETNRIDDLLPGVTIDLRRPSGEPIELKVEADREAVKESLIEFVGFYNQLVTDLNIMTSRTDEVVNEITYFTDQERTDALEKLGILQGDITIMQLKSRVQTIMMNAYTTRDGRELALLDQIGISTNPARSGGSVDRTRLRGYLDIDEARLDAVLGASMESVKELFGRDTDGDLLVDSGVAFTLNTYVKPYVDTGGFISTRLSTISNQLSDKIDQIENFEERLARKEQEYRREYGAMEAALNTLEQSSDQLRNFSNGQNNGN